MRSTLTLFLAIVLGNIAGHAGTLTVNNSGIGFGSHEVGASSSLVSDPITITNSGSNTTIVLPLQITGADSAHFFIAQQPATSTLGDGESVTFRVGFLPMTIGPKSVTVVINSNGANPPMVTTFTGSGVSPPPQPSPLSTAFTYQGKLTDSGAAASGSYDLEFRLWDQASGGAQVGSELTRSDVLVSSGIFTVNLDFGSAPFTGLTGKFLEISVRPGSSSGTYTTLSPRQPINSAPFAVKSLRAETAAAADNANALGGSTAENFVQTNDARLSDARSPQAGSANYIQNGTGVQPDSNFNISGNGVVGTDLNVGGTIAGNGRGITNLTPGNILPGTAGIDIAGIAAKPATVIKGATPSANGLTMLVLNYAAPETLTDLTGGIEGQCVTVLSVGQQVVLAGPAFRLRTVSFTARANDTIALCRSSASGAPLWYETSRSVNAVATLSVSKTTSNGATGTVSSSPAGIDCGADCSENYPLGTVVTLTAMPGPNSAFSGWNAPGCGLSAMCQVTVNGEASAVAVFTPQIHQLLLSVAGPAPGTVFGPGGSCSTGQFCPPFLAPHNSQFTLTATPGSNSVFQRWLSSPGLPCHESTNATCLVNLQTTFQLTAVFAPPPTVALNITFDGGGGGTVTSSLGTFSCTSNCTVQVPTNTPILLSAAPASGSAFNRWEGILGCNPSTNPNSCTFTLTQAAFVTVFFDPPPPNLTIVVSGSGGGTVTSTPPGIDCGSDCDGYFDPGTGIRLTATPAAGSVFSGWSGFTAPSCNDNSVNSCTFNITQTQSGVIFAIFDTSPGLQSSAGEVAAGSKQNAQSKRNRGTFFAVRSTKEFER